MVMPRPKQTWLEFRGRKTSSDEGEGLLYWSHTAGTNRFPLRLFSRPDTVNNGMRCGKGYPQCDRPAEKVRTSLTGGDVRYWYPVRRFIVQCWTNVNRSIGGIRQQRRRGLWGKVFPLGAGGLVRSLASKRKQKYEETARQSWHPGPDLVTLNSRWWRCDSPVGITVDCQSSDTYLHI